MATHRGCRSILIPESLTGSRPSLGSNEDWWLHQPRQRLIQVGNQVIHVLDAH
jgi:hypothetical protein